MGQKIEMLDCSMLLGLKLGLNRPTIKNYRKKKQVDDVLAESKKEWSWASHAIHGAGNWWAYRNYWMCAIKREAQSRMRENKSL